ncbi:MAG: DNA topoisomerase III, partial [Muribaculaceae bacterium]|nr:DNA topoisomerase III [Muribaculaceae bacterium]
VFFPDMEFMQTTVKGKSGNVEFKTSGKIITNPGWKKVYATDATDDTGKKDEEEEDGSLPDFQINEEGPHQPFLAKRTSQPPKYYTEGTLLKAMETAGANVEDEELRDALKANGIGRPSTRAAIIEILYKRGYIRQERKSLRATQEGINLINIINEELLKSAKLTGIWENKLRRIERGEYSAEEFIDELKLMISEITLSVLKDNSMRKIGAPPVKENKK